MRFSNFDESQNKAKMSKHVQRNSKNQIDVNYGIGNTAEQKAGSYIKTKRSFKIFPARIRQNKRNKTHRKLKTNPNILKLGMKIQKIFMKTK